MRTGKKVSAKGELAEIEGTYRAHTPMAIRISVEIGPRPAGAWIPKSQVHHFTGFDDLDECSDVEKGDAITLFIPLWLAESKGLV